MGLETFVTMVIPRSAFQLFNYSIFYHDQTGHKDPMSNDLNFG
jgi:hypothetical protein